MFRSTRNQFVRAAASHITLGELGVELSHHLGSNGGIVASPDSAFLTADFVPVRKALSAAMDSFKNETDLTLRGQKFTYRNTANNDIDYFITCLTHQLFAAVIGQELPIAQPGSRSALVIDKTIVEAFKREEALPEAGAALDDKLKPLVVARLNSAIKEGLVARTLTACIENLNRGPSIAASAGHQEEEEGRSDKAISEELAAVSLTSSKDDGKEKDASDNAAFMPHPLQADSKPAEILPTPLPTEQHASSNPNWVASTAAATTKPRGYTSNEIISAIIKATTHKDSETVSQALQATAKKDAIANSNLTTGDITRTLKSLGSANPMGDAIKVTSAITTARGTNLSL